jgi:hypothetical protein
MHAIRNDIVYVDHMKIVDVPVSQKRIFEVYLQMVSLTNEFFYKKNPISFYRYSFNR